MHYDITPDSVAAELFRRARLDVGDPMPLEAFLPRLGLVPIVGKHRTMHGASLPGTIYYDGTRDTLAHELGHEACKLYGLEQIDEPFVVAVAASLVVPRDAYRRAMRHGLSVRERARTFRVQETCAALREGETTGRPVAVWCGPGRILARGEWHQPKELVERMVRARHKAFTYRKLGDRPKRVLVALAAA